LSHCVCVHIDCKISPQKISWIAHTDCLNIIYQVVYGLWCLTSLSTIFQLYHGDQLYCWRITRVFGENHRPVTSHWQGSNSQLYWWWALIAKVVVNPTTIRSWLQQPHICITSMWTHQTHNYNGNFSHLHLQQQFFFLPHNDRCIKSQN
jgi:hypothetical protein